MDRTLANFIRALRNSEVRISTAETLDAFNAVELVGYRDRAFLKRSLSLVLPKTLDEKETFDACFDQFFSFEDVRREAPGQVRASEQPDAEGATADDSGADGQGEGEGGAGGDRGETAPAGGDQRRGKGKRKSRNALYAEEEEPDLGPGEMSAPTSALGA
ncbi:MAG: hypothetical protein F4048_00020, partial [Gammaproteobacteria bacterium]|nr:hypothetical protein [Gammaproteobacteria bacterium]